MPQPYAPSRRQAGVGFIFAVILLAAPPVFTSGLLSYFTSDAAPFELPGAPLLAGSLLMAVAMLLLVRTFRRH